MWIRRSVKHPDCFVVRREDYSSIKAWAHDNDVGISVSVEYPQWVRILITHNEELFVLRWL